MSLRLAVIFAITAICCPSLPLSATLIGSAGFGPGTRDEQPMLHVASPTVVYVMDHDLLRGLDLTDPANPVELFRRTRNHPDFFTQVLELGGGSFYGRNLALPNEWGLFDASDPTNPQLIGAVGLDLMALGGWVEGNSLFLVTDDPDFSFSQLMVELSIADPLNPVLLQEHQLASAFEFVTAVLRKGDRVFVVGGDYIVDNQYQHYLRHYDLAAWPAAPSLVETVSLGGFSLTRAAALVEDPDGIVAAARGHAMVRIDQKNNGTWETNSYAVSGFGSTEIAGGFRDANGDLHLLGMNPSNGLDPVAIYSYNNNGTLNFECNSTMTARTPDDHLLGPVLAGATYVLPLDSGVIRTGSYDCVGGYAQHTELPAVRLTAFRTAELAHGHAYVGGPGQVDIYDLADPLDPIYLRSLAIPFTVEEFEPYDPTTLLAWDRQDQLAVLDLGDPANPSVIATHALSAAASPKIESSAPRLRCSAPYFVVVESVAGMATICDFSVYEFAGFASLTHHATTPIPSATPSYDDFPHVFELHGTTAYVAQSSDTHVIDFSTPSNPVVALVMPDVGNHLAIANGALFVEMGNPLYVTRVFDLNDPSNPSWLTDLDETGKLLQMDDLMLVWSGSSAAIYDVTQPAAPQLIDPSCAITKWPNDPYKPSSDGFAMGGVYPSSFSTNRGVTIHAFDFATAAPEPGGGVVPISVTAAPNPSSGSVRFAWRATAATNYSLEIYDLRGRLVRAFRSGPGPSGMRELLWQGTDRHGNAVASGNYFVVLESAGRKSTQKLVLMR